MQCDLVLRLCFQDWKLNLTPTDFNLSTLPSVVISTEEWPELNIKNSKHRHTSSISFYKWFKHLDYVLRNLKLTLCRVEERSRSKLPLPFFKTIQNNFFSEKRQGCNYTHFVKWTSRNIYFGTNVKNFSWTHSLNDTNTSLLHREKAW